MSLLRSAPAPTEPPSDGSHHANPRPDDGTLGDGTTTSRLTPVAVVGGLSFSQVSGGGTHVCGHTPEGRAYCWGFNLDGQLGIGNTSIFVSPSPVPVAGPM